MYKDCIEHKGKNMKKNTMMHHGCYWNNDAEVVDALEYVVVDGECDDYL